MFSCTWHLIQPSNSMGMSFFNLSEVITKHFNPRLECFGITYKVHSAETLIYNILLYPLHPPQFMFSSLLEASPFIQFHMDAMIPVPQPKSTFLRPVGVLQAHKLTTWREFCNSRPHALTAVALEPQRLVTIQEVTRKGAQGKSWDSQMLLSLWK